MPKHQTRWDGFDDKIISLYARGMTVREIQAHLQEMYGIELSPSLISSVTDAVSEEVKAWQARPLHPIYPIIYLDCIHVKVREGAVRVKAVSGRWHHHEWQQGGAGSVAGPNRRGQVLATGGDRAVLPGAAQHQPEVVDAHRDWKAALTRFTIEFGDRLSDI